MIDPKYCTIERTEEGWLLHLSSEIVNIYEATTESIILLGLAIRETVKERTGTDLDTVYYTTTIVEDGLEITWRANRRS